MTGQREIIEIPARAPEAQGRPEQKLRVAAYCRVSTNQEAQQNSYQTQRAYYLEKIASNPDWVLADIFADEGITGTSTDKRTDFRRMIRWCKQGKIDLILAKSISRFARNTVDCLRYVRMLKELDIPVIFETERLDTSQMDSEFFLAMLGANSQAESEATSSRIKWGVRAAFREGKVRYQYKRWLGYRKGEGGTPEIVPAEAQVVKQIYDAYLAGHSLHDIKFMLEKEGVPTKMGLSNWSHVTIQNILQNERYTGDVLLQKTFITDPITKRQKKNRGELPQYLVKNCHPAIISHEMFDLVQEEIKRRTAARTPVQPQGSQPKEKEIYSSKYALSGVILCGECASPYRRCTWRRDGKVRIVWRCQNRLRNGTQNCKESPTIREEDLHRAVVSAINSMLAQPKYLLAPFEQDRTVDLTGRSQELAMRQRQADDAILNKIMQCADRQIWDGNVEQFRGLVDARRGLPEAPPLEPSELPCRMDRYSDAVARQVLDSIVVLDGNCMMVKFKGGYMAEQRL